MTDSQGCKTGPERSQQSESGWNGYGWKTETLRKLEIVMTLIIKCCSGMLNCFKLIASLKKQRQMKKKKKKSPASPSGCFSFVKFRN